MSGRIRVLHVDDDANFTEMTRELLRKESGQFDVVTETTVDAALEHLTGETAGFDCIVSDYALPGTDGIDFLKTVRTEFPHLPFIFFTGRGSESVASEALMNGATDYLQKQGGTEQYQLLANRIQNAAEQYWNRQKREESEEYRRKLYGITADTMLSIEEKVERLLELGCERLGVENGHVVRIEQDTGRHTIRTAAGSEFVQPDTVTDLDQTYCRRTISADDILTVFDASEQGWEDDAAFERWGIGCYIGGKIEIDGELYGTVCFVNQQPREQPFSEAERTFVDLVARWLNHMFERQSYEEKLAEYEALIETLPIGYVRATVDGECLTANPVFVTMMEGDAEAEVLERETTGFWEEPSAGRAFLEQVQQTGTVESHELELRTLTDETIPVTVTGRLAVENGEEYVDMLVQDASER
ncbi:MAG: response regulator [Halolamina sp.]